MIVISLCLYQIIVYKANDSNLIVFISDYCLQG